MQLFAIRWPNDALPGIKLDIKSQNHVKKEKGSINFFCILSRDMNYALLSHTVITHYLHCLELRTTGLKEQSFVYGVITCVRSKVVNWWSMDPKGVRGEGLVVRSCQKVKLCIS